MPLGFHRLREAFGVRAYSAAFLSRPDFAQPHSQPKAAEYARTPNASPDSDALADPRRRPVGGHYEELTDDGVVESVRASFLNASCALLIPQPRIEETVLLRYNS